MQKPNEEVCRAIVNLSGNISWERIVQWIEESLEEQSVKNNHSTGELTIKGQGRGLELEDIMNHIVNAPTYLKNQKESKRMEE